MLVFMIAAIAVTTFANAASFSSVHLSLDPFMLFFVHSNGLNWTVSFDRFGINFMIWWILAIKECSFQVCVVVPFELLR